MTSSDADPFGDIRPYYDSEVPAVIERLRDNTEFADALARLKLRGLHRVLPGLARFLAAGWLRKNLSGIATVDQFQHLVAPQLEAVIDDTAIFSFDGLDRLDPGQSWLFISNHRDITMDPALANLVIYQSGHRTLSIAIGDNLLHKPWVADLMRLNKSFIVRRNISAPRELMAASKQLASFMRWTIAENRGPVWIAQREGRAKDGLDATEPAVIKMLAMSRDRKTESAGQVLSALNIVPLAISYELDPCDAMKAAALAAGGAYTKAENEDVLSIGLGISGQKGRVHLSFGRPVVSASPESELDVDDVVAAIDNHIRDHYRLFETALWAWQRLHATEQRPDVEIFPGTIDRDGFYARIDAMPAAHRPFALSMYANPLQAVLDAKAAAGQEDRGSPVAG